MPADKLYSSRRPSLKDAVVSFGGFCSGVVVSEDGLVFTNHHCGFSCVQQHSSVEHDYLKDGFVAHSRSEELPNPELYVRFLLRTEDVTKRVLGAVKPGMAEAERSAAIDSVMFAVSEEVAHKDSTLVGIVDAYYGGNEFWLSVYRDYNDVRLVFAPPSSVGKFGWDTDNWGGRAIRAISAYFVSMPIGTTARRIIRRKTSLIIPNMWLRFRLTDIKKVLSA